MLSNKKEMLKSEIEKMEKQIPCLKGKNYSVAKSKYFRLLRIYEKVFVKGEPIYLRRSE
jgi:hypothetical protein